jgi:hypothetical protein
MDINICIEAYCRLPSPLPFCCSFKSSSNQQSTSSSSTSTVLPFSFEELQKPCSAVLGFFYLFFCRKDRTGRIINTITATGLTVRLCRRDMGCYKHKRRIDMPEWTVETESASRTSPHKLTTSLTRTLRLAQLNRFHSNY